MIDLPIAAQVRDGFFVVKRSYFEDRRMHVFVVFMASKAVAIESIRHEDMTPMHHLIIGARIADQATRWLASNIVWC